MKVTLTFELPEEEAELRRYLNGPHAFSALMDIRQELRRLLKHETLSEEVQDALTKFRDFFNEATEDFNPEDY